MPTAHMRTPTRSAARFVIAKVDGIVLSGKTYRAYRLPVSMRDETDALINPPYVTVQLSPNPDVRFHTSRAMAYVDATVVAVGYEQDIAVVEDLTSEIDARLDDAAPAAGPDGAIILDCKRRTPVAYAQREADRTLWYVGGVYELHIA